MDTLELDRRAFRSRAGRVWGQPMGALALGLLAGLWPLSGQTAWGDPVMVYRPRGADTVWRPSQATQPGTDPFFHGVYQSDPYVAVLRRKDGVLRLYTDAGLRATLVAATAARAATARSTASVLAVAASPVAATSGAPKSGVPKAGVPKAGAPKAGAPKAAAARTLAKASAARTGGTARAATMLVAAPGASGLYRIVADDSKAVVGSLQVDDAACADPRNPMGCFRLTQAAAASGLPEGLYLQSALRPPADNEQVLNSAFTGFPVNFQLVLGCYHLARMSMDDFQIPGCSQQLLDLPAGDSKNYRLQTVYMDKTVGVPYGWLYVSRSDAKGQLGTRIMETGQDVVDSVQNSIGFKASVNVFFFKSSVQYNQTVKNKVENMYDRQLTYAQSDYLKTAFALVLDKTNLNLAGPFAADVAQLARQVTSGVPPDYKGFVDLYGTHYAYATTFGMRGRMTSTMTRDQVMSLHESGTDVSVAASAGLDIDGIGGSVEVDGKTAKDHMEQLRSTVGRESIAFDCVGGDDCSSGHPTGATAVPVLLDLRPISDLLGPPLFTDETIITTVRDGVAKALAEAAFFDDPRIGQRAASFVRVTDDMSWVGQRTRLLCGPDALTRPGNPGPADRVAKCCNAANPIATRAAFTGVKAALASQGRVPLKLGTGPVVPAPDGRTPLMSAVQVEYVWPQLRSSDVTPGMTVDLGMDIDAFCKAHGDTGSQNTSGDGYGWRCVPSNNGLDMQQICNEQHGPGLTAMLKTPPPGGPNDWVCHGQFSPTWQTVGAPNVPAVTVADGKPYTGTTPLPANIATALDWIGDGQDNCGGVSLDMTMTLQPATAKELLQRDLDLGGQRARRR